MAMNRDGERLKYFNEKCVSSKSEAKIKASDFNGPKIHTLIYDEFFSRKINPRENCLGKDCFSIKNFGGNEKSYMLQL